MDGIYTLPNTLFSIIGSRTIFFGFKYNFDHTYSFY